MNEIDVHNYMRSHDHHAIEAVIQFLEAFGCCPELLDAILEVKRHKQKVAEQAALRRVHHKKKAKKRPIKEPPPMKILSGERCPKCKSLMAGMQLEQCETQRSDRVFYRECTRCVFYCETIETGPGLYRVICSEEIPTEEE